MNPFEGYLQRILQGVEASDEVKRELRDEFNDHLEQLRADFAAKGVPDEFAVKLAISDFGDSGLVGALMNHAISPYRKWLRRFAWMAMAVYALEVVHMLLLNSYRTTQRHYIKDMAPRPNFTPFKSIQLYVSDYHKYNFDTWFFNIFGNMLIFVPLGFLLPILFTGTRKLHRILLCSLLGSLAIELSQLATKLGFFDVDDLILNTAGGVSGFAVWVAVAKGAGWFTRKRRPQRA
ncbi:VanZ family protein [Paenibacillus rhizovicinus]|uniref:VanZ family protein n=1 Tax=Paenibacillus rhizovicinus TaxID=2704463 RepID=A0A6C0P2V0_9BACL|nr:VanZ family protein [Paenibacillus rhizovicinus]QHW32854.1 VanZ family protein [Paenibacillus rhizovicinus]